MLDLHVVALHTAGRVVHHGHSNVVFSLLCVVTPTAKRVYLQRKAQIGRDARRLFRR